MDSNARVAAAKCFERRPARPRHARRYAHPSLLEEVYRQQLIAAELLSFDADVLCLQEVTGTMFRTYLEPHLWERGGYRGVYTPKCGSVPEGCALFYRESRFRPLRGGVEAVRLRDFLDEPAMHEAVFAPFFRRHCSTKAETEAGRKVLTKLSTVAQIAALETVGEGGGEILWVVNTHFFFHPDAPHARTLHAAVLLEAVRRRAAAADDAADDDAVPAEERLPPALVLCGDLNST